MHLYCLFVIYIFMRENDLTIEMAKERSSLKYLQPYVQNC